MKLNNIMKFKSVFLAGAAILAMTSCSLEEIPRDKQVAGSYTSETDVEQAVIGAYSYLREMANYVYLHMSEVRSDNTWVDPNPNGNRDYSELGTFRAYDNLSTINSTWRMLYQVIFSANTVIENIETVDYSSETVKNQLEGEAYFLRGYAYLELARLFGNVPIIDGTFSPSEARQTPQSTATEVFNTMVIPDLLKAESLLPEPGADASERTDKIAAQAMLGRAYMQMAGFPINDTSAQDSAETWIRSVLDYANSTGKYWAPNIDEWRKQFMQIGNNAYSIFALQYRVGTFGNTAIFNFSPDVPETYIFRENNVYIYSNNIWIEKTLQYEYTVEYGIVNGDTIRDGRGFNWTVLNGFKAEGTFLTDYANQTEYADFGQGQYEIFTRSFFYKFLDSKVKRAELDLNYNPQDGMSSYNQWGINHPVIRLEDMMLLYAEILVSKGQIASAMQYVNDIRSRAGIDPVPSSPSASDAMEYIKRERRLELAGEGVRWFDQVRYGEWEETTLEMFDRYMSNGTYPTGIAPSNVRAGRYYYPIPATQMEYDIYVQNTGY